LSAAWSRAARAAATRASREQGGLGRRQACVRCARRRLGGVERLLRHESFSANGLIR